MAAGGITGGAIGWAAIPAPGAAARPSGPGRRPASAAATRRWPADAPPGRRSIATAPRQPPRASSARRPEGPASPDPSAPTAPPRPAWATTRMAMWHRSPRRSAVGFHRPGELSARENPGRPGPTRRLNSWGSGYFRMTPGPESMRPGVGRPSSRCRSRPGHHRGPGRPRRSRSRPAARPLEPSGSGISHPWVQSLQFLGTSAEGCTDPSKARDRSRPFTLHDQSSRFIVRGRWFPA